MCQLGLFGGNPSPGVCLRCTRYSGPERPPHRPLQPTISAPRRLPEIGPPTIDLDAIAQYLQAVAATTLLGNVSLPVIEARTRECTTGGPNGGPCPMLRQKHADPDPIGYCGACKCGSREEAALSRKVTMRGLKLPAPCLWTT